MFRTTKQRLKALPYQKVKQTLCADVVVLNYSSFYVPVLFDVKYCNYFMQLHTFIWVPDLISLVCKLSKSGVGKLFSHRAALTIQKSPRASA